MTDAHVERRAIRRALLKARLSLYLAQAYLETTMTKLDDVQAALGALSNTVDTYEARENDTITQLNATITTMTAQLAAGSPGLTDAQGQALLDKITAISAKLAVPVPAPAVPPTP